MHVYLETPPDEDGYPPVSVEEIHAEEVAPGLARLTGTPVFAMGVAPGDVVQLEVRRSDAGPWVVAVVEPSAHWVTRVVSLVDEPAERIVHVFENLGCAAFASSYGLVAVDVPPEVAQDVVLHVLEDGRTAGRWDFDLGVDPRLAVEVPQPGRSAGRSLVRFLRGRRRRRD